MACRATARSVEIGLARLHVSRLQVGHVHAFTFATLRHGLRLLGMNKGRELCDLFRGELKSRHSLVDSPMQHNIPNLVSAHIRADQLGPGEIRTGFASAGIAAVTESAILLEKRTTRRRQVRTVGRRGITPVGGPSVLRRGRRLPGRGIDV